MTEQTLSPELPELPDPLIIPRAEHPISRKDIDPDALKVLRRLVEAGHKAFLVGGGVRDLYIGKRPKDFDISTSARPGQVRKLFRNSRVIGRRFRLVQVFFGRDKIIEVSTFRRRSEYDINGDPDAVLPANNTFGTPAEDAFRRDLTINALFYDIEDFSVIDYTGGVEDLQNRIVRIVGDPERRITRDPVRMMRVIRHAARAAFEIEPLTWEAIIANVDKLTLCPVSRIRDELFKDLRGGAVRSWIDLATASGLFYTIFPFYREILEDDESAALLRDLLAVVDRLHGAGHPLTDGMLLAILLLPWACKEMDMLSARTQKEAYGLSRAIREQLQEMFKNLNIKRSMQDEIARSLSAMPLVANLQKENNWPKWLQKKSYFTLGRELFAIYREATGGEAVEVEAPAESGDEAPAPEAGSRKNGGRRQNRRGGRGGRAPAFAPGVKGGVFGFLKS